MVAKRSKKAAEPTVELPVRLVQDILGALEWIQSHKEAFPGAEEWVVCPKTTMMLAGDLVREIWNAVGGRLDDSVMHSGRIQPKPQGKG